MPDPDITVLKLRISGVVQGVGYRAWAAAEADKLGVIGWMRNRSDGTVEALVSGSAKTVEAFVAACARGPADAQVTNIDLLSAAPPVENGFHLRPTL